MLGIDCIRKGLPLALLAAAATGALAQSSVGKHNSNAKASDVASEESIIAGSNKEKVICRTDKPTGSRVTAKRVCKTAQLWEIERIEARRTVERGQNERVKEGN